MKPIKIITNNIKKVGLKKTLDKIFSYVKNKIKYIVRRLPVLYYYYKLKTLKMILPRSKRRTLKILKFKVYFDDLKSLYIEYKDIFKNQIYHFDSVTDTPLIIDGGGFIGFSVLYFKYIYPKAKIIVFEPSKPILEFLNKNINQNKLQDISIVESGLGIEEGTVSFEESSTDAGKISQQGNTQIKITKLSSYIDQKVDFVKLNIEGAELAVLQDLEQTNKFQLINEFCIEWHSFSHSEQNLDEGLKILKNNGYKYLINHFDYITNKEVKPPFKTESKTQYYLLVYAKKN